MYKLTVVKQTINPNFEAQLREYNQRVASRYSVEIPYPEARLVDKTLEVELTDEEYQAVKKAVLETM